MNGKAILNEDRIGILDSRIKVEHGLSFLQGFLNDNTEDLREWLHLPDDDLTPVTDDDMDELFL